ncbi:MAG: hypothetical protein OHK0046_23110 [Anaerolineae bacterium]
MRFKLLLAALLVLVMTVFSFVIPAVAHEGREVGEYNLVFGWRVEPALVGVANGPEILISLHEHGEEAEGEDSEHGHDAEASAMDVSLQVEVSFGPATRTLELYPVFGETGHYVADLIPTRPGDYTFRVFGTIDGVDIDETFSSADGEFSSVEPASDVMFPDNLPAMVDLMERIEALEARLAALEGE